MATEESDSAEFQEKTGLKRKLTGPPRLLLGKSRSPGRDEKKSRKHRRHNNDDDDTLLDKPKDELDELKNPESPETVLSTEVDVGTCMDLQEECLETPSDFEQNMKKRQRRSKAGATIRWIFSCVRKRKELGMKAVEDAEDHRAHNRTHSDESVKMKHGQELGKSARTFKVRMWRIFKRRSSKGKQECDEQHGAGRWNDTFTEISSTSVDHHIESPALDEDQNESSGIDEDVTGIHLESRDQKDPKIEVMEVISLNVEMNVDSNAGLVREDHQHPVESHFPCLGDEEIQISEVPLTGVIRANSDLEDARTSPEDLDMDDMLVDVPVEHVFKCKPIIMIEDVHSLDEEENDDLFENAAPQYGTLSPFRSLNGSCYTLKTSDRRFSDAVLAQTASSLVRAAISGAIEQLSAEPHGRQMDQDHV